jgi:clan AA aspartic protease
MIRGVVSASLEAIVLLPVRDASGQDQSIPFVVDTGYDGFLTLPIAIIQSLGLPLWGKGHAYLADGSKSFCDIDTAEIIWDRQLLSVQVEAVEADPLLGMELLRGFELRIQLRLGGLVTIEPLPPSTIAQAPPTP